MGNCNDTLFRRVETRWTWIKISGCDFSESKDSWEKVSYEKPDELDVSCSCSLFETEGIFCRHILCILWRNHVTHIPESYILQRWRMDACYKNVATENGIRPFPIQGTRGTARL